MAEEFRQRMANVRVELAGMAKSGSAVAFALAEAGLVPPRQIGPHAPLAKGAAAFIGGAGTGFGIWKVGTAIDYYNAELFRITVKYLKCLRRCRDMFPGNEDAAAAAWQIEIHPPK